jgi:hypothetical protein
MAKLQIRRGLLANMPSSGLAPGEFLLAYDDTSAAHLFICTDTDQAKEVSLKESSDKTYRHLQATPEAVWSVSHFLNKYPSVTVVDSAQTVIEGEVKYLNTNELTIRFSAAFSGEAHIN